MPIARVLTADCPWRFGDSLPGDKRGAASHYETMTTAELCALKIPPTEPDALLFLWRVASMPQDALDVVRSWGFVPKTEIVWEKLSKGSGERRTKSDFVIPSGTLEADVPDLVMSKLVRRHFGMGRITRASHETCIVATRGRASRLIEDLSVRDSFFAPVGEHSEKPEAFYRLVERLSKGPYIELFARRPRPRWTTIGSELGTVLTARVSAPVAP